MAGRYVRFLTYMVIGLIVGLAAGFLLELIGAPHGWWIVIMLAGAIVGAILYVAIPPARA